VDDVVCEAPRIPVCQIFTGAHSVDIKSKKISFHVHHSMEMTSMSTTPATNDSSSRLSSDPPPPLNGMLVLVSSEGERFTVEERLAEESSPYFEALLSNHMQESGKLLDILILCPSGKKRVSRHMARPL
jgi:hypothetical protein